MSESTSSFLRRIFPKLGKEVVASILTEKSVGWVPQRAISKMKREDLLDDFLELSHVLDEDELEEFLELALTTRTIGYPAYTFKINDMSIVEENPVTELNNYTFLSSNQISINSIEDTAEKCNFKMQVKEHSEARMQDVLNSESLTARHPVEITVDKREGKLTMIVGKHSIEEMSKRFIQQVIKWPISGYNITEDFSQSYEIGTTNYKTALIIDFVYNRLKRLGYNAKFKEIKFLTRGESSRSKGIRNVTINGNDILSSQLACEYVTVGSAIISFKLDLIYADQKFSASFFLKGDDHSQLKIVLVDISESHQKSIMNTMQQEYIDMSTNGISDMGETKNRLEVIREKYLAPDKFVFESIQNVLQENNAFLLSILTRTEDEEIRELIGHTAYNNRILLDNTGFSEEDADLTEIAEQLSLDFGFNDELEIEDGLTEMTESEN